MFKGFRNRAGLESFTAIPNELFDEVMKDLNGNELKILLAIFRKTYGWAKEVKNGNIVYKLKDQISLSQFENLTGLSTNTIKKYLNSLQDKGFIIKVHDYNSKENSAACYKIRNTDDEINPLSKLDRGCEPLSKLDRGPCQTLIPQKKDIKKYKTEEEESIKNKKLSTNLKSRYQLLFNRTLSNEIEKEILSICKDEKIIQYCLFIAEKNADKPSWILRCLQDWKEKKLKTISDIENYLEKRKGKKSNKMNNKDSVNTSTREERKKFMQHLYR